ncbi:MAG TPA: hypothetical protein VFS96_05670 [Nitrolancea sp.]|nr:hypothetical protein [Nitrolancea sp.]
MTEQQLRRIETAMPKLSDARKGGREHIHSRLAERKREARPTTITQQP